MKLKLKRKFSGKVIKKLKRKEMFHPETVMETTDYKGNLIKITVPKTIKWENKGLYDRNRVAKRHTENPNIYDGEQPIRQAVRNIRPPKKSRKTAWKRFKKAFPYVEVDNTGRVIYTPLREIEKFPLNPIPKKKIN
jgi:hypothetical protein